DIYSYTPDYTFYIHPIIKVGSLILLVLGFTYICLRHNSFKEYKFKPIKTLIARNLTIFFFLLTFIWISFAFLFSDDYEFSFWDVIDYKRGYAYFLCYVVIVISILLCTKKQKFVLLELLIFVSIVINLIAIIAYCTEWHPNAYRVPEAAIFSNRNFYAYYLSITTLLSAARLYLTKKPYLNIYYAASLIISEFALLISQTRGAFVGVVVAIVLMLVYFGIRRKFSWKLILVPAIMIITFLVLEISGITVFMDRLGLLASDVETATNAASHTEEQVDAVGSGRIAIWKDVISKIKTSPIVGLGIGSTLAEHNEYLQIAAWSGIPAALFYICALFAMVINLFKKNNQLTDTQIVATLAAISYAVQSFFGYALLQTAPFYIIVLALSLNPNFDKKVQETEPNCP
nr:O-antigen ligase family protein [Clostridia bacterium]